MLSFEKDNVYAYTILLRIEILMRECLKDAFESELGPRWRQRLPAELLKKIKESEKAESRPQFSFIRLGPLYYLTFGELCALFDNSIGKSAARRLGGESFVRQLANIFAPRNAVCHSRPVTPVGLQAISLIYAQMETALNPDVCSRYLAKPDAGMHQQDATARLLVELSRINELLPGLPGILELSDTHECASLQYWWSTESLAGFCIPDVDSAYSLIHQYNALPQGVGSASARQSLCEASHFANVLTVAIETLKKTTL